MLQPDNKIQASVEQEKIVSIIRIIDLPISEVWKAWTEAESFKKWWGSAAYTCPHCEIDLRGGGKNLNCMPEPEGKEFWTTATYLAIDPMKRLVYIDNFSDSEGNPVLPSYYEIPGIWSEEIKVSVTFQKQGLKTKIILEQEGIPEEVHHDYVIGWNESFNKMEVSLKK